jgi:hypothetical protein
MKKDRNPIQREKNGDIKFLVGDNVNNSNNKKKMEMRPSMRQELHSIEYRTGR